MEKSDRIYVTGHQGMLGSAVVRALRAQGFDNLLLRPIEELDLTRQSDVEAFFAREKPAYVFQIAARVGGILANKTYPAEFIRDNLLIEANVIDAAYRSGAKKLLFTASTCMYPKEVPQPMREEYLMSGPLGPDTKPYGLAKLAGECLCASYRRQYDFNAICVLPSNLYGIGDNYHPENSHVIPGMIRRFHEAKVAGSPSVTIWGSGAPYREFLYSEDAADGLLHLMQVYDGLEPINLGSGKEIDILQLAHLVADVVDFKGKIETDPSKPDGAMRKCSDVSRVAALGWRGQTSLREGLKRAYSDFLQSPLA